ncbi:MAG: hypothetical protein AAGH78_06255 [Cyanobacteria bacterium P01_H01_bin.58]
MSTMRKPEDVADNAGFSAVPDSWTVWSDQGLPLHPVTRFDSSHTLTGMPVPKMIPPQGCPETLRLPKHAGSVHSAIAILLEDELKLVAQGDTSLRDAIGHAITLLELTVE